MEYIVGRETHFFKVIPDVDLLLKFLKKDIVCAFTKNRVTYVFDREGKLEFFDMISEEEKKKMVQAFSKAS